MWFVFGMGAMITAGINLYLWIKAKNPEIFRFISISLTALTLAAVNMMNAEWVKVGDWGALIDVVLPTAGIFFSLVVISILLNGITLIKRK